MALKILSAADPITVDRITVCLYGDPGVGKTTLAFTADKPLLLDFDNGAHRAANRRDTVRVTSWADVDGMTLDDLAPYNTVIVDTVGRMLDALSADIIAKDAKMGRGGVLSQQGWGRLKARFVAWAKMLNASGKDVILIAHGTEKQDGENVIARLDVQGGSKDEIYKSADAMGRVYIRNGKRVLNFDPTESAFGKNPAGFGLIEIPTPITPDFMATIIADTKAALNRQTEEQREAAKRLDDWREVVEQLETVEDFNARLEEIKTQPKAVQQMFANAAKAKGYVYDRKAGRYEAA